MWDARIADNMAHIELSRGKDAIVVAPATADFIAKLAHGPGGRPALDAVPGARMPADRRAGDEPPDVGQPGDAAQRRAPAARRRGDPRARERRPGVRRGRHGPHARGRARSPRRSSPSSRPKSLRGRARADHRRPDVRGDRRGARHHQPQLRQDGLRGGACRARGRRQGDADLGPDQPRGARRRATRGRRIRARDVRGGEEARRGRRHLHQRRGGRRLPRRQVRAGRRSRKLPAALRARARAQPGHPRVGGGAGHGRRSASASPRRAENLASTPKRSAAARKCRCSPPTSRSRRSARTTTRSPCSTTRARTSSPRAPKEVVARQLVAHIAKLYKAGEPQAVSRERRRSDSDATVLPLTACRSPVYEKISTSRFSTSGCAGSCRTTRRRARRDSTCAPASTRRSRCAPGQTELIPVGHRHPPRRPAVLRR